MLRSKFRAGPQSGRILKLLGKVEDDYMISAPLMPLIRETLEASLASTNVTLICDYHDDCPDVTYIEQHIILVFTRLAANAIEAMPDGGMLHLSARTSEISEFSMLPILPGDYLHISLVDSGKGIPPDALPNIFDPYFSTKDRGSQRGMGLSLALCHTVIMKHGGIITAESSEGRGTTFDIWLPIASK